MDLGGMPYAWPVDADLALWELGILERDCPACELRNKLRPCFRPRVPGSVVEIGGAVDQAENAESGQAVVDRLPVLFHPENCGIRPSTGGRPLGLPRSRE